MTKENKIYVGNKIKTNEKFKPISQNGTKLDLKGKVYRGTVINKRGELLIVDFHKKLPFTHYVSGLLSQATGYALFAEEVIPIDTYKSVDKQKQVFFNLMTEFSYKELEKIPDNIYALDTDIHRKIGAVKNLLRDIASIENEIVKDEFKKKKFETKKIAILANTEQLTKQYTQMKKNKKIDTIKILNIRQDTNILLTTKDLTYKNPNSNMPNYILGAYKILIPIDSTKKIYIINFKKHVQKFKYQHPCIYQGEVCFGSTMANEVCKLRQSNNMINLIHLLINFLEEPNYGEPHLSEELFYCSQKVKINPKNEEDWFRQEYWNEFEKWDGAKYTRDMQKIQEKLKE